MQFLESLEILFIVSAVVVFLLHKARVPSLVGFLLAGVIIGPHGFGLISNAHAIELLAEIGVVLLLFTIGIELSMANLLRMKKAVVGGGGLQVVLTIAVFAGLAFVQAARPGTALFLGFLVSLSSTAIVLKMLAERGETDTPHGRVMVGILIFQDLCIVPLMLLTPALSGQGVKPADIALKMGEAALVVAGVLLSSRWLVPVALHQVVSTRNRELFITTIIVLCLGIAILTSKFGLSPALGAFLAGLIISESEYAHQAMSDILPFKDSFLGIFFVSVGMILDAGFVAANGSRIAAAVGLIVVLKTAAAALSAVMIGMPLRSALHAGIGLAQVGEFSFVLALSGKTLGVIDNDTYQVFLAASIVTMILTPLFLHYAGAVAGWLTSRHLIKRLADMKKHAEHRPGGTRKTGHVIIVGFGLNGRNLARVLKEAGVPYVVLEMNSDTVAAMKKKGEPIHFGDATSREILAKMGLAHARLLVVAISDPASTRRIVSIVRHENPAIHIIVRTKYLAEVDDLRSLGADEVIPEEFETSVEIFSRVLHQYRFPRTVIADMTDRVRSNSYTALRRPDLPKQHLFERSALMPEVELDGVLVPEDSPLSGKTIAALQIRKKTGVTIIAVRRGEQVFANPDPLFTIRGNDILMFTGPREAMAAAAKFFGETGKD
ncbi:MAG: monovalent cation:proton antiporter-2 (CPA2) family protein [Thermodesulfovibrionales bacterium]